MTLRPLEHLHAASKNYPDAWKMVDQILAGRGKDLPDWPSWCFMPMAGWYSIVSADQGGGLITDPRIAGDIGRLSALGTWRYSQGYWKFDQDLLDALIKTSLSGDIPTEVLLRLPQWCIFAETPGLMWMGQALYGFWAHLEHDANDSHKELRLLFDIGTDLAPFPIHLGPWPLMESVTRAVNEAARQLYLHGHGPLLRDAKVDAYLAEQLQPVLAMILYLCSDEPDTDWPKNPKPSHPALKKTKKGGWRLFPAEKVTVWKVGAIVGARLRKARAEAECGTSGKSPRGHIRDPHWHGYWVGSGEARKFIYHWLPHIFVRGRETAPAPETG